MKTVTATEAARRFSALLDEAAHGATIEIMRGGEHVATMTPPIRQNGTAIIDAYRHHEPDEEFADAIASAHATMNTPVEVEDPWAAA